MNIYKELLLEHYRNPRNRGNLDGADFSSQEFNPSCGDRIIFQGKVQDGIISELWFTGHGCVISQATASLLIEHSCNKSVDSAKILSADDIKSMLGTELGPTRLKCALLPLQALQKGLISI